MRGPTGADWRLAEVKGHRPDRGLRVKDFFISYAGADRPWAEWIGWTLEAAGYSVLLDIWDFRPGSNFVLMMHQASGEAERTLAVLSPTYLQATFTNPEWASALRQDPTGAGRKLIPVRIDECDVEGLLGPIIYIDLVGVDEIVARDRLLEGVRPAFRPSQPPPFPTAREQEFPGSGVASIDSQLASLPSGLQIFRNHWTGRLALESILECTNPGRVDFLAYSLATWWDLVRRLAENGVPTRALVQDPRIMIDRAEATRLRLTLDQVNHRVRAEGGHAPSIGLSGSVATIRSVIIRDHALRP